MKISNIIPGRYKALLYSLEGLKFATLREEAFQIELLVSVVLIPAAFYFAHSGVELAILLASWLLVLILELINSAIEATVDRISEEHHELSKLAKDYGSAAVFLGIVNVVVVWGCVLFF